MNKMIHMYVYYQHANQSKNHVSSRSIGRRQGLIFGQAILLLLTIIISQPRAFLQWVRGKSEDFIEWLYDTSGLKQLDQWLLKELLFPEQSTFAIRMNTLFGFIILNIIFNQVFLDPLKLTLQILSEEIIRAAAPHLGATAYQILNHTVKVSKALRSGLDK